VTEHSRRDERSGARPEPATEALTFRSDVLDLRNVDLTALAAVPGSVLDASLQRLSDELSRDNEVIVGWRSSLPSTSHPEVDPPPADTAASTITDASPLSPDQDSGTDQPEDDGCGR
jgi:FXSXX-COOH protein